MAQQTRGEWGQLFSGENEKEGWQWHKDGIGAEGYCVQLRTNHNRLFNIITIQRTSNGHRKISCTFLFY